MGTVGVLVCNAARARLFELRQGDPVLHLHSLSFHEPCAYGALHLVLRDQPGAFPPESAALPCPQSVEENERKGFARFLARGVNQAIRFGRFQEWILIAPKGFLSDVVQEVGKGAKGALLATHASDLDHVDEGTLHKTVAKIVAAIALTRRFSVGENTSAFPTLAFAANQCHRTN